MKLGKWSKKLHIVSISNPQLQVRLSESRKPCLNLCSRRWLKPRYLIPLVLKQLYVLLGEGLRLPQRLPQRLLPIQSYPFNQHP